VPAVSAGICVVKLSSKKKRTSVRFEANGLELTFWRLPVFCSRLSFFRRLSKGPSWRIFRPFQLCPCQTWRRREILQMR